MKERTNEGADYWRGSYTVELSLLMGMILSVLVSILYMGFFLHDRGFTQAAAHEGAAWASLQADEKGKELNSVVDRLAQGRMLGTQELYGSSSQTDKTVQITYKGKFHLPEMAGILFGQSGLQIDSGVTLTVERPSRRIQKIRGLTKVVNRMRRRED